MVVSLWFHLKPKKVPGLDRSTWLRPSGQRLVLLRPARLLQPEPGSGFQLLRSPFPFAEEYVNVLFSPVGFGGILSLLEI